jgi:hypothetical protein
VYFVYQMLTLLKDFLHFLNQMYFSLTTTFTVNLLSQFPWRVFVTDRYLIPIFISLSAVYFVIRFIISKLSSNNGLSIHRNCLSYIVKFCVWLWCKNIHKLTLLYSWNVKVNTRMARIFTLLPFNSSTANNKLYFIIYYYYYYYYYYY